MIKVLHLLSDQKFVQEHVYRFEASGFENHFIFITVHGAYEGIYQSKLTQFEPFSPAFEKAIAEAPAFDVVIAYNLDYYKSYFVNRLPPGLPVVWYFYGTELYAEPPFRFKLHSRRTKRLMGWHNNLAFLSRLKRIASRIKYRLLGRLATYTEIARAISRVDYLSLFSREEYDYLKTNSIFKLPEYLRLAVCIIDQEGETAPASGNTVLICHSATPDCNHADIIDLFKQERYAGKLLASLSYGENGKYRDKIKQLLRRSGLQVEILERFTGRNDYVKKINACKAAIFNSYRQLALGTIHLALRSGVKVYLNERNPSFDWLVHEGFRIFSVEENLRSDVGNDRMALSAEEQLINREAFRKLADPGNNKRFLQTLEQITLQHRSERDNRK